MVSRPHCRCSDIRTIAVVALCVAFAEGSRSFAQVNVLTYHNDNARSGQNLQETILTPANVNQAQFGKLFHQRVDGFVYAEPLYVSNVAIPGKGFHNVVYVATEHDSVYAFDADSNAGSNAKPLWETRFAGGGMRPVPSRDVACTDLVPEIGITGTPVIDATTGTLYVVVKTKENHTYMQRLHALDISTGQEKLGGPVVISTSVPGNGDGSNAGVVSFDPLLENQRAGLLLTDGIVYVAWASHCDNNPYHGWVMGFDAATLSLVAAFNSTPDGGLGGIWQGGAGLSADASGAIYFGTGNGTFDADVGGRDFGDSLVKLSLGGGLTVADYFTPTNQSDLNSGDNDFGSSGALLLPDQPGGHAHLAVICGKEGKIYVVDRDNMGHFNPTDDSQIVESIPGAVSSCYGGPAYWNGTVYYGSASDALKAFALSGGLLSATPTSATADIFGFPGVSPTISANGTANGIVWVLERSYSGHFPSVVLHAYDATDMSQELYNSTEAAHRDVAGQSVKFVPPTVANGKVYVAAHRRIAVYGLL